MIRIQSLTDHPALVPTIARWHWQEWGTTDIEGDVERRTAKLRTALHPDRVPVMFVALDHDDTPLGTSALSAADMSTHPELTPWLANVYVTPEARGRGIGRALVSHAMAQATVMGYPRLYLYTHTADGLYAKLGWQVIGHEQYEGHPVILMRYDTAAIGSTGVSASP